MATPSPLFFFAAGTATAPLFFAIFFASIFAFQRSFLFIIRASFPDKPSRAASSSAANALGTAVVVEFSFDFFEAFFFPALAFARSPSLFIDAFAFVSPFFVVPFASPFDAFVFA